MDFSVEAVKYIITEQCQRVSTNNRENAYCVEYTGKGWKISPADREHLCWSEGDNTFYLEPKPSERTEEFIASCRYPESETAIAIAKKLIQRHEKQEYTTWSFRMLKDRNNDNKTLDIIRDKLNGSCYEDYDDYEDEYGHNYIDEEQRNFIREANKFFAENQICYVAKYGVENVRIVSLRDGEHWSDYEL